MYGTSRSSYQKMENVRIIARHGKPIVDETKPGARSRNIQAIYIENSLGERFRLPEGTTLNGARAYAQHVRKGGTVLDEFGQHIGKIIKEMRDLKLFVRNMRGRQFEDTETNGMVEAAIDHYGSLHTDLFTLRTGRGYDQYRDLWQPELMEDEFDIDALKERFVKRVFDDRMLDALPVVKRAYDKKRDKVGEEFEAWANSIVEEDEDEESFVNTISPMTNTGDGSDMDSDVNDSDLDELFKDHEFEFTFRDSTYWFESHEEMERAKDILAADDPHRPFPEMGVSEQNTGSYGASTFDRELPGNGVKEDTDPLSLLKTLSGLTK
jgi:hypothetical protein